MPIEGKRKVLRKIVKFHQDEEHHWVADLDCGHAQHTRHDPPFFPRPWVLNEEGRASYIGTSLDCVRCDRQEIPEDFVAYRRTPTFTSESMPIGLRRHHSTKRGVWGVINVLEGQLKYRLHEPYHSEVVLDKHTRGIVLPEVEHEVTPLANAEFYVEFWHRLEKADDLTPNDLV
jgi:tellurite methyltransferase